MEIIKYTSDYEEEWDKLIECSINGTIFHKRKFINYHHKDKFIDDSLIIKDKNNIIALFPAAEIKKGEQKILKSHPGTSYGGPVIMENIGLRKSFELLNIIEKYAKENFYSSIEFRICPKIFHINPCDELEFAFIKNRFIREDEELSTCYQLKNYKGLSDEKLIDMFPNRSRRNKVRINIKKALSSNLKFRILDEKKDINKFYMILENNLKKHKTLPTHSLDEIHRLFALLGDNIELLGVYKSDIMIAGYLLFKINHNSWHIFYASVDYEYQNDRPTTFGLFKLLQYYSNLDYKYVNIGISTEDGGRIINWGLFDFKESFNGMGIMRTYWKKNLK